MLFPDDGGFFSFDGDGFKLTLFTFVVPNCATKFAMLLGFSTVVQNAWKLARFYLNTFTRFIFVAGDYGKDSVIELIELVILKFFTIDINSLFLF